MGRYKYKYNNTDREPVRENIDNNTSATYHLIHSTPPVQGPSGFRAWPTHLHTQHPWPPRPIDTQ